jgi:hypothetical protein
MNMGSAGGTRVDRAEREAQDEVDLPPAALARWVESLGRRRAVAQALHAPPPARAPQISDRLEGLRGQLAAFRAQAIGLHAKLKELEAQGDPQVQALRAAMMVSVVRIEGVVRALVDTPDPAHRDPPRPQRFARGTRAG